MTTTPPRVVEAVVEQLVQWRLCLPAVSRQCESKASEIVLLRRTETNCTRGVALTTSSSTRQQFGTRPTTPGDGTTRREFRKSALRAHFATTQHQRPTSVNTGRLAFCASVKALVAKLRACCQRKVHRQRCRHCLVGLLLISSFKACFVLHHCRYLDVHHYMYLLRTHVRHVSPCHGSSMPWFSCRRSNASPTESTTTQTFIRESMPQFKYGVGFICFHKCTGNKVYL